MFYEALKISQNSHTRHLNTVTIGLDFDNFRLKAGLFSTKSPLLFMEPNYFHSTMVHNSGYRTVMLPGSLLVGL